MYIRGVNLGNWLVLEKWMHPALFGGSDAADEYYLPRSVSRQDYEARIRVHRSEYVTERDFLRIRAMGLEAVRIPVPYFIFGDREPFIGCIEELDRAFCWAERYGLKILIDLHTAPWGQNGFDNGGICGVCKWCQKPEEVAFVLSVLERLAERYGEREALWGIEVLNEPVLEDMWAKADIAGRYPPVDAEMAAGSVGISEGFIKQFYLDAYDRLRKYLPKEKYVVIHDAFHMKIWKDFMREEQYGNVVLDTHLYLPGEVEGGQTVEAYESFIRKWGEDIAEMQQYFPVICGEWCLSNPLASACGDADKKKEIYNALGRAQLSAWKCGSGYFYWSYKLLMDMTNGEGWSGQDSWDLGRSMDLGWFPEE